MVKCNGEVYKIIDEAEAVRYDLFVDEVIDLSLQKITYEVEVSRNIEVIFKAEI